MVLGSTQTKRTIAQAVKDHIMQGSFSGELAGKVGFTVEIHNISPLETMIVVKGQYGPKVFKVKVSEVI